MPRSAPRWRACGWRSPSHAANPLSLKPCFAAPCSRSAGWPAKPDAHRAVPRHPIGSAAGQPQAEIVELFQRLVADLEPPAPRLAMLYGDDQPQCIGEPLLECDRIRILARRRLVIGTWGRVRRPPRIPVVPLAQFLRRAHGKPAADDPPRQA